MQSTRKKKIVTFRVPLMILSAILFLWFLIPAICNGVLNIGNETGLFINLLIFLYAVFINKINEIQYKIWKNNVGKCMLSVVGVLAIIIILLTIVITGFMINSVMRKPEKNTTLIVLGCSVYGERPSLMLKERMDAAIVYLDDNPEAVCIVSGGKGDGENISEAECMNRYLIAAGIGEDRIIKEDRSTSTRENMQFSKELMQQYNLSKQIAIATNDFHVYRASVIASELGLSTSSVPGRTVWWLLPTYYVRELFGVIYQWLHCV